MRIPLSFDAFTHRVQKRLGRARAIVEAADEVLVVHAAEEQEVPPAFFLPGQLERARATIADSTLASEIRQARAETSHHVATLAMRFERARLIDGAVYANGAHRDHAPERRRLRPTWLGSHEIDGAALPSTLNGNRYFGHFIAEDCCTALLARELAPVYFTATRAPRSQHAERYREIYGLPARELRTARLRNAWLFQDFAMTPHKRDRFRRMRERTRSLPGEREGHGVFLRRRGAGVHRGLENEREIEERLAKAGYEIIDVAGEDADTVIRRTKGATVVCGVEGSAFMHGLFSMGEGGALVCMQPPYRFNVGLKEHSDALGFSYGFVVGEGSRTSFRVSVDELLRTLDLAWARAARASRPFIADVAPQPPTSSTELLATELLATEPMSKPPRSTPPSGLDA